MSDSAPVHAQKVSYRRDRPMLIGKSQEIFINDIPRSAWASAVHGFQGGRASVMRTIQGRLMSNANVVLDQQNISMDDAKFIPGPQVFMLSGGFITANIDNQAVRPVVARAS